MSDLNAISEKLSKINVRLMDSYSDSANSIDSESNSSRSSTIDLVYQDDFGDISAKLLEDSLREVADIDATVTNYKQEVDNLQFDYDIFVNVNKKKRQRLINLKNLLDERQNKINELNDEYTSAQEQYKNQLSQSKTLVITFNQNKDKFVSVLKQLKATISALSTSLGISQYGNNDDNASTASYESNASEKTNDSDLSSQNLNILHDISVLRFSILSHHFTQYNQKCEELTANLDQNTLLTSKIELEHTLNILESRSKAANERLEAANQILSQESVEISDYDVHVIETTEHSIIEIKNSLNRSDADTIELSAQKEYDSLIRLIKENKIRAADIARRQSSLSLPKKKLETKLQPIISISQIRNAMIPDPDTLRASPGKSGSNSPKSPKNDPSLFIQQGNKVVFVELKRRQQELLNQFQELEYLSVQNLEQRAIFSKEYDSKMEKLQELQKEDQERTNLLLKIEEKYDKNDKLQLEYQSLKFKCEQLKSEQKRNELQKKRVETERDAVREKGKKYKMPARRSRANTVARPKALIPMDPKDRQRAIEIQERRGRIQALKEQVNALEKQVEDLQRSEESINQQLAATSDSIEATMSEIEEIGKRINFLSLGREEIGILAK